MVVSELRQSLKQLLCDALELEDVSPSDIDDDAPLFGEGLGLDSVDALELAIEIEKRHGIRISQEEKDRAALTSIAALAHFLEERGVDSVSFATR